MEGEERESFDWLSGVLAHGSPIGPGTGHDEADDEPGSDSNFQSTGESWRETWRRLKFAPEPEPSDTATPALDSRGGLSRRFGSSGMTHKPAFLTKGNKNEPVKPAQSQAIPAFEEFTTPATAQSATPDLRHGRGPIFEPGMSKPPPTLGRSTRSSEPPNKATPDFLADPVAPPLDAPVAPQRPTRSIDESDHMAPADAGPDHTEDSIDFDFDQTDIPGSRLPRTEPFAPNQPRMSVPGAIFRKLRRR